MDYSKGKRQTLVQVTVQPLFKPLPKEIAFMEAPYTVRISCLDAAGKEFQLFEQRELPYEVLVATQEAIANAFVAMGKAGVELRRGNAKP